MKYVHELNLGLMQVYEPETAYDNMQVCGQSPFYVMHACGQSLYDTIHVEAKPPYDTMHVWSQSLLWHRTCVGVYM